MVEQQGVAVRLGLGDELGADDAARPRERSARPRCCPGSAEGRTLMASPELPPAEKVTKLFFVATVIGMILWVGSISFFVLRHTP